MHDFTLADWTGDFQKFCRPGLDRIQFYRIRIGLGLKNFTVRPSLMTSVQQFFQCCFFFIRSGVFLFYLFFLLKICFFYSGQILEMYVVLLYFPFTDTVISQA